MNVLLLEKKEHWTLATVENLGILYVDQGRPSDAERMFERALAGKERAFGRDHTSSLSAVRALGSVYRTHERLADAENLIKDYRLS